MDPETAPPPMSDPSTSMFHKATGGNVKDSKLINSGRDTIHNVYNNFNLRVFPDDGFGFIQFVAQPFVWWTRRADGKEPDEVEISSIMPADPSSLHGRHVYPIHAEAYVGYPLYEPDPFSQLSKEYIHNGVNIGDVGFIREDGAFDFMFNICPPQNRFTNPPNLPDGFSLELPEHCETKTMKPLPPATRLFPPNVTRTITGEYICEGFEGAILELPEGAIECVAINNGRFADLAKRHGVEWYEYTKNRGRGISNGSLYLVTSFTKCTHWAIAVFDRPCELGQGLTFSLDSNYNVHCDEAGLHANFNSLPVHPSDFINAALLSQNPDAKVALTHDDVWCDLLRNNFPKLDYAELMNIARLYTSTIEYGGVSLEKIRTLPLEFVEYILLLLDTDPMLTCTLVNREFNEIIQSSILFQDYLARQPYLEEFKTLRVVRVGFDHFEGFCTSLSNLYKSVAAGSIDRNRWKVTKISTIKSTRLFEYQSLVAEVVCGQIVVYLRFERKTQSKRFQARKSSKATPKTQTSDDSALSPNNATYSRTSDEITYSEVYTDIVSYYEKCVDVIHFPEGKGLSLPQIAVLARCVNNLTLTYSLLNENSYWFPHVMVETAKLIEPDVKLLSKQKRYNWQENLPVRTTLIEQVKAMYDEQWVSFIQDINDSVNNPNSEIYQKALQREAEEREKRVEAERLVAEKDHLIAEAQEEIERLRAQLAALEADGANSSS